MITMRVVQVAIDQVANMVAVRDGFVTATWAMNMPGLVPVAAMVRRAGVWIPVAHFNHMLVHVVAVGMMQVPIMQIINVITVLDGGVPAAGAMVVWMIFVFWIIAVAHIVPTSWKWSL
ncbi:MAG: hypothetical protein K0U74_17200 [Alphaproteobacteria bacterium]|nr:hypothetical protein [Alphaproteobacteria bacterium]